ncbi:RNA-binding protein [Lactobacillus selangorensis]|uniref:RNA-binding protein KhpB n=1 Tax=Lactobacillus selangorensis TaxID=81857 RepID=A0A0R2FX95_9LACO|nr:RNA-binding cell elongation regulator Jag/EloR [Lactobacillus selangorensis]KRN28611.1 RNA-binding protein [Lactobacillus selangorensis]KRN32979.1 RNA-binding protein [Lactobacillus selangorensis]
MPTFQGNTIQDAIEKGLAQLKLPQDRVNVKVISEGKKGFFGLGKKPAIVHLEEKNVTVTNIKPAASAAPVQAQSRAKAAKSTAAKPAGKTPKKKAVAKKGPAKKAAASKKKPVPQKEQPKKPTRDDQIAISTATLHLTDITARIGTPTTVTVDRVDKTHVTYHLQTDKEGLLIGKHGKTINALQYLTQVYFNHNAHSKILVTLNVGRYRERREATLTRLADKAAREVIATGQPVFLDPMPSFERKQIHAHLADNQHVKTHSEGVDPHRYVIVTSKMTGF